MNVGKSPTYLATVIMRLALRGLAAGVLVLVPAGIRPNTLAQEVVSHGPTLGERRPWHVAQRLRPVLERPGVTLDELLEAATAELALGRASRALALLDRVAADSLGRARARYLALLGEVELAEGRLARAAARFDSAARVAAGLTRGLGLARAADALEQAGRREAAATAYREARDALPGIGGWVAVREARVTGDPRRALALVALGPPEAAPLAGLVRGAALLAAGDTLSALRAYAAAGADTAAARLALTLGEESEARRYAYAALGAPDTAAVRRGWAFVESRLAPRTNEERLAAAAALLRLSRQGDAARHLGAAVRAGDSSGATLLRWGEALEQAGRRADGLAAYAEAARDASPEGQLALYRRARLLLTVGRTTEGQAALQQFADRFPEHPQAPQAAFLLAESRSRVGRRREADSLLRHVGARWPRDVYAGRARMRLAIAALERGDSATAEGWLRAEMAVRGPQHDAAQFLVGRLRAAAGDTVGAVALWTQLGRVDSLGYYGLAAREAAGLPEPVVAPPGAVKPSAAVRAELARLDLLRAAFPEGEEAALLMSALALAGGERPVDEELDLAEGLIERGWVREGVRLGWDAAARRTLHDPRVLRVVYPWPYRDLTETEARKFGVDPYLLAGLIRQESIFLAEVTSRAGARGLMQLMPVTAVQVARRLRVPWDDRYLAVADANVHVGVAHLASLLERYDGDVVMALAAYNAGTTPVAAWRRAAGAGDAFLFVESIPYGETRSYVRNVVRHWRLYRALYSGPGAPGALPR